MFPLTIIIPSFNRSFLLEKTLHSFTLQTQKDFHIIVIDHGSTDDTREMVASYQSAMSLEYHWLPREGFTPGIARDFGVRRVQTPIVVFLDSGIIVPSFFVQEHSLFHQQNEQHVGLGWYHGYRIDAQDPRWEALFKRQVSIDEVEQFFSQDLSMFYDQRKLNPMDHNALPWLHGWGGNLSFKTKDYFACGGFDADHTGWGWEDLDLAYRLSRLGLRFAYVENGWAVHLPHPSEPRNDQASYKNCQRSYRKLRTLALEAVLYAQTEPTANWGSLYTYLEQIGRTYSTLPTIARRYHQQFARPSLLIGGTIEDAEYFDHVTLADESIHSTESIWSCSGILIPLPAATLDTVVVSDMWKWLDRSFCTDHVPLLDRLIMEIKRTAKQAYFVDSASLPQIYNRDRLPITVLQELCQKHELTYHIIPAD